MRTMFHLDQTERILKLVQKFQLVHIGTVVDITATAMSTAGASTLT